MQQLVDSTAIDSWFVSTRRRAQELLPHLVRRLVYATKPLEEILKFRIPVGDEVSLPGFDGELVISGTHFQIPSGRSIWEMGVANDPGDKANRDYRKRTDELAGSVGPAFVFVTPHPWPSKTKWVAERIEEKR